MINVTDCLFEVVSHIAANMDAFSHIDPNRVLICYAQSRNKSRHGTYAKIFPTCFPGGKRFIERGGRRYVLPTITVESRSILYLLYFYYPRFQDLRFEAKLLTLFHELYHISPKFDGDLRRFPGKNYAHGRSRKEYDERLKVWVDAYLARYGDEPLLDFLRFNFAELRRRFGYVTGSTMRMPKALAVI